MLQNNEDFVVLKERIYSAIILVAFVLAALFLFDPFYFALTIGAAITLAIWEWTQFANVKQPFWRFFIAGLFGSFLFLWIYSYKFDLNAGRVFVDYAELILFMSVIWWAVALIMVITFPASIKLWQKSTFLQSIFALCTLIPFFIGALILRLNNYVMEPLHGVMLLLYVFILVWAADSGAYFVGRKFGKTKLAPKVSPGKSWQGVFGGLISAGILATIFVQSMPEGTFQISTTYFIALSIATVAISILGDLTESMFKREAGIKDSSHLIPGHGGILDRIDSLTAAVPFFAYFYFYVL